MSRNLQIATAVLDSTGLCLSVALPVLDNPEALQCVVDLVNARHGLNLTIGDVGTPGPPGAARRTELQPGRRLHPGPRPPAGLFPSEPEPT